MSFLWRKWGACSGPTRGEETWSTACELTSLFFCIVLFDLFIYVCMAIRLNSIDWFIKIFSIHIMKNVLEFISLILSYFLSITFNYSISWHSLHSTQLVIFRFIILYSDFTIHRRISFFHQNTFQPTITDNFSSPQKFCTNVLDPNSVHRTIERIWVMLTAWKKV